MLDRWVEPGSTPSPTEPAAAERPVHGAGGRSVERTVGRAARVVGPAGSPFRSGRRRGRLQGPVRPLTRARDSRSDVRRCGRRSRSPPLVVLDPRRAHWTRSSSHSPASRPAPVLDRQGPPRVVSPRGQDGQESAVQVLAGRAATWRDPDHPLEGPLHRPLTRRSSVHPRPLTGRRAIRRPVPSRTVVRMRPSRTVAGAALTAALALGALRGSSALTSRLRAAPSTLRSSNR